MSVNPVNTQGQTNQSYKRASLQDGNPSSGGFLLNSGTGYDHDSKRKGKRKAIDGEIVTSGRIDGRSFSSLSSKRKSRVSSRQSYDTPDKISPQTPSDQATMETRPGIDAEQIVRMALSLSESRRMSLRAGHLPSPGTPSPRQATQTSSPLSGTPKFSDHVGGAMSTHLQSPRRFSRSISTNLGGKESDFLGAQFSPATLSRAEKARRYIELYSEYRRLLQVLPPLKNQPVPQRNRSTSVRHGDSSGSHVAYPHRDDVQQTHLGRIYNPLQYVRNRKIRHRDRQWLDGEAEGWEDVARVSAWINSVEDKSEHPNYHVENVAMLPEWVVPIHGELAQDSLHGAAYKGKPQRKASTFKSRPKYDWLVNPADLLADAYWLEQGDHKAQIEDHYGYRLFPDFKPPEIQIPHLPSPRIGYDEQDSVKEDNEGPLQPPNPEGHGSKNTATDHDSEEFVLQKSKGKMSRATRTLLRRRRASSASSSNLSVSDAENASTVFSRPGESRRSFENIGPLAKHMKRIIEAESRNHSDEAVNRSSSDHWDRKELYNKAEPFHGHQDGLQKLHNRASFSDESAVSPSQPGTPRISVEMYDNREENRSMASLPPMKNDKLSPATRRDLPPFSKSKPHRLDFLRRGKSKEKNLIEENDFALSRQPEKEELSSSEQGAKSKDKWYSHDRTSSVEASKVSLIPSIHRKKDKILATNEREFKSMKPEYNGLLHLRSGRLGELVREEKPLSDFIWKRRATHDDSRSSSASRHQIHSSEDDSSNLAPDEVRKPAVRGGVSRPLTMQMRSHSASDLGQAKYHFANLPAFRSSIADAGESNESKAPDDIARIRKGVDDMERRKSRVDQLAPSALNSSDVSPHTSTLNLAREKTAATTDLTPLDRERTYGLAVESNTSSRSTSAVRSSGIRLNDVLSVPGGVGIGGLPKTGLSGVDTRRNAVSRDSQNLRSWSIADGSIAMVIQQPTSVTAKELEYVRAMLMSSGVKARNLVKRSYLPRDEIPAFLLQASETSGLALPEQPIPRNKEHVWAARLLSKTLETSVPRFDEAADRFRGQTCMQLHEKIDELTYKINLNLTPRVKSCGDDADAFIARLTTEHTMSVTQLNDSIDLMMRSRRRRLRLLSKLGFAFLEWLLVGIMWGIWLIVTFVHVSKRIIFGTLHIIRWLLWL